MKKFAKRKTELPGLNNVKNLELWNDVLNGITKNRFYKFEGGGCEQE